MRSARVAEWILSQVLAPDRAVSTIGDWMEESPNRGHLWFWSCVFRTLLSRIWGDFAESPGFMIGLGLRGWLYSFWLVVGTYFGLFVGTCILVGVAMLVGFLAHQVHWHPLSPAFSAMLVQIWIGWCEFQTGRWIARRAPGRELAAGVTACLSPIILLSFAELIVMHFRSAEIDRFMASHPDTSGSLLTVLPSEIFLLGGILWSRHKSVRRVVQ